MRTIIVQIADRQWTTEAMHFASALARNTGANVILLVLILAKNPCLLGQENAVPALTPPEYFQIHDYSTISEDYGIETTVQFIHYASLSGALEDAVRELNADVLFAKPTTSRFKRWQQIKRWWFQRSLRALDCKLYTLEDHSSMIEWIPVHLPQLPPDLISTK